MLLNANFNKVFIEKSKKRDEKKSSIIEKNKIKQKNKDIIDVNFNVKVTPKKEEIKLVESSQNYLKIRIDN